MAKAIKAMGTLTELGGVSLPRPGSYKLDPNSTRVEFSVKHMVVSTARGALRPLAGMFKMAADPFDSWVRVDFDAASFSSGNSERDAMVKSQELLDVSNHPIIRFESFGVEQGAGATFVVPGDLYVKGVSSEVRLQAQLAAYDKNEGRADFAGMAQLSRAALGLTWGPVLERVGVVVSDKLQVKLTAAFVQARP